MGIRRGSLGCRYSSSAFHPMSAQAAFCVIITAREIYDTVVPTSYEDSDALQTEHHDLVALALDVWLGQVRFRPTV
jgi:hypothetical protein